MFDWQVVSNLWYQNQQVLCLVAADFPVDVAELTQAESLRLSSMSVVRRQEFIRGRSVLQQVLKVVFGYCMSVDVAVDGRLYLAAMPEIGLSLSHFKGWVLVGVSGVGGVGVDLVRCRNINAAKLAARILTPAEYMVWQANSADYKFIFRYWAIKEACIKFCGNNGWQMLRWEVVASLSNWVCSSVSNAVNLIACDYDYLDWIIAVAAKDLSAMHLVVADA